MAIGVCAVHEIVAVIIDPVVADLDDPEAVPLDEGP